MKKVKANIYGSDTDPPKGVNNQYLTKPNAISQPCLLMAVGVRNSGKSYAVSKIVAQAMKDSVFDKNIYSDTYDAIKHGLFRKMD